MAVPADAVVECAEVDGLALALHPQLRAEDPYHGLAALRGRRRAPVGLGVHRARLVVRRELGAAHGVELAALGHLVALGGRGDLGDLAVDVGGRRVGHLGAARVQHGLGAEALLVGVGRVPERERKRKKRES